MRFRIGKNFGQRGAKRFLYLFAILPRCIQPVPFLPSLTFRALWISTDHACLDRCSTGADFRRDRLHMLHRCMVGGMRVGGVVVGRTTFPWRVGRRSARGNHQGVQLSVCTSHILVYSIVASSLLEVDPSARRFDMIRGLRRNLSVRLPAFTQVLGTPTLEEIQSMNQNYSEYKFPQACSCDNCSRHGATFFLGHSLLMMCRSRDCSCR